MKKRKKILIISAILLIVTIIGYIAFSFTQINTKSFKEENYLFSIYKDKNNNSYIDFGNFENIEIFHKEILYEIDKISFKDGIFNLTDNETEKEFLIGIVDENTIYCSTMNEYLYKVSFNVED